MHTSEEFIELLKSGNQHHEDETTNKTFIAQTILAETGFKCEPAQKTINVQAQHAEEEDPLRSVLGSFVNSVFNGRFTTKDQMLSSLHRLMLTASCPTLYDHSLPYASLLPPLCLPYVHRLPYASLLPPLYLLFVHRLPYASLLPPFCPPPPLCLPFASLMSTASLMPPFCLPYVHRLPYASLMSTASLIPPLCLPYTYLIPPLCLPYTFLLCLPPCLLLLNH